MDKEIQSIRARITDRIVLIAAVFLTPAYGVSLARWLELGWSPIHYVHSALYMLVVLLLLFRKRMSTNLKIYGLVVLFTFLGIVALWFLGFSGVHYFVVIAIAIASVLLPRKLAYWLIALIACCYLGIGMLFMLGVRNSVVDLNNFSHSVFQWTAIIISLVTFAVVFTDGFGELYEQLVAAFGEKGKIQDALEKHNKELKATQSQLARKLEEINTVNLKLKLSEEKYRTLVDFSPDIVYWYSSQSGGLYFSERTNDILGYSPGELMGNSQLWASHIHPDDWVMLRSKLEALPLNQKTKLEYRMQTKNNEWIWVSDTFLIIKQSADEKVIQGHLTDITRQKRIEQELHDSEERWHFSVDGSDMGLWDWNLVGETVFYSRQWKQILGYQDHEIDNNVSEWKNRIHPEDLSLVTATVDAYLQHGAKNERFFCEYRMRCKDRTYKWVQDRGRIHAYAADGSPTRMIGTLADVTERKLAEIELRKSNATKDKFFSIIAHDLKNPFGSMIGFSEMLHENFDSLDSATKRKFVAEIHEGMTKTYALLDDLLLWSRAQRNTIGFSPQRVSLNEMVDEITSVLLLAFKNKSIHFEIDIPRDARIYADRFMLSTILRNLITNAIKFTPKNGRIAISFATTTQGKQSVSRICVRDNGVGIPPEDYVKIFDIAQSTLRVGTENERGTGMGLPICYEFVSRHGGNIWFESEVGKGSAFYVALPQEKDGDK